MRILIVEDNHKLADQMKQILKKADYSVDLSYDGEDGYDRASGDTYDLVILDLMLPGMDGMTILKTLRKEGINTPILILSAKSQTEDKVEALDIGADDYLTKPFASAELIARVRTLLRRKNDLHSNEIHIDDLLINTRTKEVMRGKRNIPLTAKEYELLEFLAYNKNSVVSRNVLGEHVWGESIDLFDFSNFIDVHVKNLRKKINVGQRRPLITTKRGVGFMLSDPVKK